MNKKVKEYAVRIFFYVLGSAIIALGGGIYIVTGTGNDCFGVLMQGTATAIGIPNGVAHFGINFLYLIIIFAVDRKYIHIGTFLAMMIMGPVISLSEMLFTPIISPEWPYLVRFGIALAACVVMASGLSIAMTTDLGVGPNDLISNLISDKLHIQFRLVRITVDVLCVVIGWLLGGPVGVITVAAAFVTGPVVQFVYPRLMKIIPPLAGMEIKFEK